MSNMYLFKKSGSDTLLVTSRKKPEEVRRFYKASGYHEAPIPRNKNGIPIAAGRMRIIRQDVNRKVYA